MTSKPQYIYDIDDRPPIRYAILYALQWAVIIFPTLVIIATLSGKALNMGVEEQVRFLQLTILTSGFFTGIQSMWGHRYPLLDGPATALLLTFIMLAPSGIAAIQGGMILGGAMLILLVLLGKLTRVISLATPNVVGVILMLIAFTLLPHLTSAMIGASGANPNGDVSTFLISLALVVFIATLSHRLSGFWKTVALLLGMIVGTLVFSLKDSFGWRDIAAASWLSMPLPWTRSHPVPYWPALIAFAASYVAALVNSLGSLHGIAKLTDEERLPTSIWRGVLFNGIAGVWCGMIGIVGMVSYSMSPGVILANRVASRYATAFCGVILIVAAFVPKLAALLSVIPFPVVGAAMCVAMGVQVGAALAIISGGGMTGRDYFVVGLPILLGTLVGFLPEGFVASAPAAFRVFLGNGLIVGIFLVLFLEHLLLRKK